MTHAFAYPHAVVVVAQYAAIALLAVAGEYGSSDLAAVAETGLEILYLFIHVLRVFWEDAGVGQSDCQVGCHLGQDAQNNCYFPGDGDEAEGFGEKDDDERIDDDKGNDEDGIWVWEWVQWGPSMMEGYLEQWERMM